MREHATAPLAAVCSRNFLLGVARSQVQGPGGRHTCLEAAQRSHWNPVFDRARENGSLVHRYLEHRTTWVCPVQDHLHKVAKKGPK